jgi:sulfate permease, SulP family
MTQHPDGPRDVIGRAARLLPAWLRTYERADLPRDVSAGVTVGVLLVPQGMAYAALAGMPPITGLYAALVALVVYALSGTSSHLNYGPVALVSLLTAAAVGPLSDGDPARYALLAAALAVMVGVLHVLLGLLRAGTVVDLIAHPVIVGFTAAAGIVIALTQARDLLGIDIGRSERAVEAATAVVGGVGGTHLLTFAIGAIAVALLVLFKRVAPRLPGALLVVIGSIVVTVVLGLDERGVRIVGDIPAGLPGVVVPLVPVEDLLALLPLAAVLALVSFAESISIGKSIAGRTRETLDANRELLASGAANVAAGLAGGFPVAGSFSRSFLTFSARGRTALSGVVAALLLLLTLTLLTPLLEPLPRAVLAAIVLVTVVGLVDVREARRIARVDTRDGAVLLITFVATLVVGIELGLAIGVGVNLLLHVAKGMRPDLVVLGRIPGTDVFRNVARQPGVTAEEGLVIRYDGPLDFLSARNFTTDVRRLVTEHDQLRWIVLNCAAMSRIDSSGLHALHELQLQLRAAGIDLRLANMRSTLRDIVHRADLAGELLEGATSGTITEALLALGLDRSHPLLDVAADEQRPEVWY